MRTAVIDIGTNSTRLLIADIDRGRLTECERRSTVTRLGRGVDTSGRLADGAIADVCDVIGDYLSICQEHGCEQTVAIATSAVRDASNGGAFIAELRERFALEARVLDGETEARLTYSGAVAEGPGGGRTLVIDIGGGSTELVVGQGEDVAYHASLQAGVVRHTERHLRCDPCAARDLEYLAGDVRRLISHADVPTDSIDRAIAVAGTPTSLAAIDQRLEPYRRDRVHGYELALTDIQRMCSELSTKSLTERERVPGLIASRAPTIVAGVVILIQVMRAFTLDHVEVSENDILWGAALEASRSRA